MAPHLVLEWIGSDYRAIAADRSDAAFRKINPAGAVPALDTGEGWILTQAGAVLQYLARRFPDAGLSGDGTPRDDAEVDRWSSFFTGDLHPAFFPLFVASRYTTNTDEASLAATKQAGILLVQKQLALLDAHMAGRRHIVGDRWSIVDAYAFPMLRWASSILPDGLSSHPNAQGLLNRLQADAAVQRVLRAEGLA